MIRTALALVLIALFFAVGGGIIYVKNQTTSQTFTSDFMKIQFEHPSKYYVEEKFTTGRITNEVLQGKALRFGTYGTNFETATDHINNLVRLNKHRVTNIEPIQNRYSAAMLEKHIDNKVERSYFFVKDYAVYYFSTDDPALFSDLDAIAKSFRILD